jgi:hypothetical protein
MEITRIQKEMLRQMLEWDKEYAYNYYWFNDLPDKKILKKEMRGLISKGFVEVCRGGINDDGQLLGGTGFVLNYERRQEIKELVLVN